MKKKIIVVLATDFHARSFYSGRLLETLLNRFEVVIAKTSDVTIPESKFQPRIVEIEQNQQSKVLFSRYLDAALIRNLRKSKSFRFRLKRFLFGDYSSIIGFSPHGLLRLLKAVYFALPKVYLKLCEEYRRAVAENSQLSALAEQQAVELIVCWAQSMEPAVLESILVSRRLAVPSLVVYDNWDNLSSKTVMLEHPDHVVCFGESSKKFAESVHGMSGSFVHPLGSARFDSYNSRVAFRQDLRKEVLIAGSSIALEDHAILTLLSQELGLKASFEKLKDFRFLYRPHPTPQGQSVNFSKNTYIGINLDESAKAMSASGIYWQDQELLSSSLFNKKLVIASPTTLLLEALLAGCFVIIPALEVKGIKTSNRKMLQNLEHLKGIGNLPNLKIVYSPEDLAGSILEILIPPGMSRKKIDLGDHVTLTPGDFSSRFADLLSSILKVS